MSLQEKLLNIQAELKAPKGQYNSYGNYKYRSCEDILEAVKPLLKKYNCVLRISDDIEHIGERYYIKAIASIEDVDEPDKLNHIINIAYAREEETKKGMDGAQITGTASSYARKYALNGLFLIDDTKDADTDEHAKQTGFEERKASPKQINIIRQIAEAQGKTLKEEVVKAWSMQQASDFITEHKGEVKK